MDQSVVILLLGLLVGSIYGQEILGNDWSRGLTDSINQLTANIQGNVQRLNQDIQEGVRRQLDNVNKDIAKTVAEAGSETMRVGNTGSTIVINGAGGTSRRVLSGTLPNGEPYFRDSEDRVVGHILHHTERIYNPETRKTDETGYTLDLKDPNAKPVPVQF